MWPLVWPDNSTTTNRPTLVMRYGQNFPIVVLLLMLLCLLTIWILSSSINKEEEEKSRMQLARQLIAAVFQREAERREEWIGGIVRNSTANVSSSSVRVKRNFGKSEKSAMEIDLNGTWNLNRSEGFEEYLRETGVGWVKRQMATSLGQTLTINHQELHFEIMVTFIGIYTKTLTFDIGDEFEIDVGPTVNTQVRSSIKDGKLILDGECQGKHYKNTRFIENGELVQIMELGDVKCKRIFTRKS